MTARDHLCYATAKAVVHHMGIPALPFCCWLIHCLVLAHDDTTDATASAKQQFPIPGTERLEHSQLGPMMTAGLTESEERRGLILHLGLQGVHHRDRGVPEARQG